MFETLHVYEAYYVSSPNLLTKKLKSIVASVPLVVFTKTRAYVNYLMKSIVVVCVFGHVHKNKILCQLSHG